MKIAVTALAGAFIVAVACLAITPARHWTQAQAVCRGDATLYRGDRYVKAFGQDTDRFDLICARKDGRLEGLTQPKATLGGIGVSLGLGLLGGALAGVLPARRRRTS